MKIVSLIAALIATAALTAFGEHRVVRDVKHGAKKAGEETARKTHHKSRKSASKTNVQTTEQETIDRELILPAP